MKDKEVGLCKRKRASAFVTSFTQAGILAVGAVRHRAASRDSSGLGAAFHGSFIFSSLVYSLGKADFE